MTELPVPIPTDSTHWVIAAVLFLLGLLQSAYYFIFKNHTEEDALTRVAVQKALETNNAVLITVTTLKVAVEQQHNYHTNMLSAVNAEVVQMRKINGELSVAFGKLETRLEERWKKLEEGV